jgi:hypothetical protein
MSESLVVNENRSLTEKQSHFVRLIVQGLKQMQAAELAGYSAPSQDGCKLMRLPHILEAIQLETARRLAGEAVPLAVGTLINVMRNEKAPASARVSAANSVLDRAGIGVRKGEQAALAKDPENMNLDELNTFIQAGAAALASKRSSATAEDAVIVLDSAQNKADEHDIPSLDQ